MCGVLVCLFSFEIKKSRTKGGNAGYCNMSLETCQVKPRLSAGRFTKGKKINQLS